MPRPCACRRVRGSPKSDYFKPIGVPLTSLEEITLTLDEYEAVRLADLESLYHEEAAEKMRVSRQTFGNIIAAARKKVADSLINGKALKIEGGAVQMMERRFLCSDCQHAWTLPHGSGRPAQCPQCQSLNFHRAPQDRGWARTGAALRGGSGCRRGSR